MQMRQQWGCIGEIGGCFFHVSGLFLGNESLQHSIAIQVLGANAVVSMKRSPGIVFPLIVEKAVRRFNFRIYDTSAIEKLIHEKSPDSPEFFDPPAGPFYKVRGRQSNNSSIS